MKNKKKRAESWKPVPGFGGRYFVSNMGNVKNFKNKLLKYDLSQKGYARVKLTDSDGTKYWFKVHRLVADLFIPNIYHLPQVNHIDENKLNNKVGNLCWVDNRTNAMLSSKRTGAPKPVAAYNDNGEKMGEYRSMYAASKATGIDRFGIAAVCIGTQKTAGGFKWKYKDATI